MTYDAVFDAEELFAGYLAADAVGLVVNSPTETNLS